MFGTWLARGVVCTAGVVVCASGSALPLQGEHFVDAVHGTAGGNGSAASPWKTITQAMASGVPAPGDIVHVLPGLYDTALGEQFPVTLLPGVDLVGPGDGTARIRHQAAGALRIHQGNPATTSIRGLSFLSVPATPNSSAINVSLSSGLSAVVADNMITGSGVWLMGSAVTANVDVSGNVIRQGGYNGGIWLFLLHGSFGSTQVSLRGNSIEDGLGDGVNFDVELFDDLGTTQLATLNLEDNTIRRNGGDGIALSMRSYVFDSTDGHNGMNVALGLYGNASNENAGDGLSVRMDYDVQAEPTAMTLDVDACFNEFGSNAARGVSFWNNDITLLSLSADFRGNLVAGNGVAGIDVAHVPSAGMPLDLSLGDAAGYGFNTLKNGLVPGGRDFVFHRLTLPFPHVTAAATGNWWGTTDPAAIEQRVFHFPDDPLLGLLDFSDPLPEPLVFTADPPVVQSTGGALVMILAAPESGFVPRIADRPIAVTLGGLPAENVVVNEDLRSLVFTVPPALPSGPADLVIENPGGQIGRIKLEVDCVPTTYCTPKVNSCGTLPLIASVGRPSASAGSGFTVTVHAARGLEAGLLLYTDAGADALPFHGGILCLSVQTLRRSIPLVDTSGTSGLCDGALAIDMNAFAAGALGGHPLPSLSKPGTRVHCQFWARDKPGHGSLLSDALSYAVCP